MEFIEPCLIDISDFIIPPANFVCRGYTVFTLSVRVSVRPSVTLCFLNILNVIAGFSLNLANMFIYARQIF